MALTIGNKTYEVRGNHQVVMGTIDFDSSYPKGGESLVPKDISLMAIEALHARPTNGYAFQYDHTNQKLKAHTSQQGGVLNVNTTAVGNVTTGEDNLITYSLPANTLSVNGMALRIVAWGLTANNANAKTLKVYFGTVVIGTLRAWAVC